MGLSFAQPLALWALLGLPAVVAIHFLQSRSRRREVSTLFLLERLPEETRRGAVFTRLRNGLQLWLQLLAVLLFTLLLARPMWLHEHSAQSVALVLDVSASMRAFRNRAATEAERLIREVDAAAGRTEWWILPSDETRARLYRGDDAGAARSALTEYDPIGGAHDVRPALVAARRQVGPEGLVLWITDHPAESPPAGAVAVGVGEPTPNAGFTGIRFPAPGRWEATLANFGPGPVERSLRVEVDGAARPPRTVRLRPGGLVTVGGEVPRGAERGRLTLESDAWTLDDVLPFVVPSPKPLRYRVDLSGEPGEWAHRVMDTVNAASTGDPADVVWRASGSAAPPAARPGEIRLRLEGDPASFAAPAPVDHPLVRDLAWSGFVGRPYADPALPEGAEVWVWMGDTPLIAHHEGPGGRVLFFNFDWAGSNADRLPAVILLLHRFLSAVRDALPRPEALNLETGQEVDLPRVAWGDAGRERFVPLDGDPSESSPAAPPERAPDRPGTWTVFDGEQTLLRAGVYAGDVEEADLRGASMRAAPEDLGLERRKRNSETDFLRPLWFALLGLTLAGCWWSGDRRGAP